MRPVALLLAAMAAGPARAAEPWCEGRAPCRVAQRLAAGRDAAGLPLTVLRVALDPRDTGPQPPPADEHCAAYEWWLQRGADARPLVRLCNDGYGAAGVGLDGVSVAPNRFRHSQSGGSAWRNTTTTVLQLAPLRVLSVSTEGTWTAGPDEERCAWDRRTWTGACTWSAAVCDAGGDLPPNPVVRRSAFRRIPAAPLPAEWRDGGWRDGALGTCSADAPYAIRGHPASARLRVVLDTDGTLYAQVDDDALRPEDRLDLWTGEETSYFDQCLDRERKPAQWSVGVLDGRVRPGFGDPEALPDVERAGGGTRVRLRIHLPGVAGSLAVAYADTDGPGPERLIATSDLRPGDLSSLGRPYRLVPGLESCVVEDGRLQVRDDWRPPATGPVLGPDGSPRLAH
jgi:hypothetical protein